MVKQFLVITYLFLQTSLMASEKLTIINSVSTINKEKKEIIAKATVKNNLQSPVPLFYDSPCGFSKVHPMPNGKVAYGEKRINQLDYISTDWCP